MTEIVTEPVEVIIQRFEDARARMQLWSAQLNDVFRWAIPNRSDLVDADPSGAAQGAQFTRGEDRMRTIFDTTAPEAVQEFANNFQLTLLPPFSNWAAIETVEDIQELPQSFIDEFGIISNVILSDIKAQLENNMDILFRYLNNSNFAQATNEALQEYSAGTGAIILNEGDFENPLSFDSASITSIVVEEGPDNKIQNVWRNLHVKNRNILLKWPKAKISDSLRNIINNSPDEFTDLIESTLYYPQNPDGFKYYYSIILKEEKIEIITEFRELNPWVVFRFSKSPNETLGRGPVLTALPKIRALNQLAEFGLASAKFNAYPAYTAPSSNEFNPYMLRIEPGTIVPVGPEFAGTDIIRPIPGAQNPGFQLQMMEIMQQQIKDILFANPLPTQTNSNETATLTNARLNQWLQKNGGAISRFGVEFTQRIINDVAHILHKKGIIPMLDINGKKVPMTLNSRLFKLTLENPLASGQAQKDANAIQQAVQFALQAFGGIEGLLTFDIGNLPETLYEKLGIPQKLINSDFKDSPIVKQIMQTIQGGQQQQQPGAIQPGPVGQTSPAEVAGLGFPSSSAPQ